MSKELIERLHKHRPGKGDLDDEAADRIEQLEAANAALRAEVDDVKQVQFPRKLEAVADRWRKKLAASQLRERQLREALEAFAHRFPESSVAKEALAIPSDTTALEAMIRKAGEVMRERCKGVADCMDDVNGLAACLSNSIRALPGVTLEDLK